MLTVIALFAMVREDVRVGVILVMPGTGDRLYADLDRAWRKNGLHVSFGVMMGVGGVSAPANQVKLAREITGKVAAKDKFEFIGYPYPKFGKPKLSKVELSRLVGKWQESSGRPGGVYPIELKADGTCVLFLLQNDTASGTWHFENNKLTLYVDYGWPRREFTLSRDNQGSVLTSYPPSTFIQEWRHVD